MDHVWDQMDVTKAIIPKHLIFNANLASHPAHSVPRLPFVFLVKLIIH